ncbi:MAG: 3-isopropylmalate dehydrogenase [Anaerolineales bacterium]|nr:3-isopropylmalate dehydrogenase [Anaerolineales bacterium]
MQALITLLPGDGIGPEVISEAHAVLQTVAQIFQHDFLFAEHAIGGSAIDAHKNPLPDETLQACLASDAVLLGAVGGPAWDDPRAALRPEQGLLRLRKEMQVFANLRPIHVYPGLRHASPLREERLEKVDILIVRELTGGLYFGTPRLQERIDGERRAVDTLEYSESEIRRVVSLALRLAQERRKHVTSVDKANVLETSRLWRQVAAEVARDFPEVRLENQLVDSAAMRLIVAPGEFDVLVTENMFGDILSDAASTLSGSLGLLPSAALGEGKRGLYEPVHGSAPDIAGEGIANPIGAVLSGAMLLRHSLALEEAALAVERAVSMTLEANILTPDLGGEASTREVGERIRSFLERTVLPEGQTKENA